MNNKTTNLILVGNVRSLPISAPIFVVGCHQVKLFTSSSSIGDQSGQLWHGVATELGDSQSTLHRVLQWWLNYLMFCFRSPQCNVEKQGRGWLVFCWKRKPKRNTQFYSVLFGIMFLLLCCCTSAVILWKYRACHQRRISSMVLLLRNFLNTQGLII